MLNCLELERYQDLFWIPKFQECQEIFFRAGWNPFLHLLQGYDEDILLLFVKGFDGKMARVGYLTFMVTEETITVATKLPTEGTHWHKHLFLPQSSHDFALRMYFQHAAGTRGFHRYGLSQNTPTL